MDGIIIVNKSKGYTSHDVVSKIRKIYNTKKVGHTGTLDPNATGVLPILIGKATKLSDYLMEHDKTYVATIKLGEQTDTGDSEGKIIQTKKAVKYSDMFVTEILKSFLGEQIQTPPIYSAIKIDGKKLYEYARKGEIVEVPKRKIQIYSIKLENMNEEEITFCVSCSKGTYIRSLCEDIANKLDTVGYMKELVRIQVDRFDIEDSYTLDEIEKNLDNVKIITIEELMKDKRSVILKPDKLQLFLNGGRIRILEKDSVETELMRVYDEQKQFIGVGTVCNGILKRDIII